MCTQTQTAVSDIHRVNAFVLVHSEMHDAVMKHVTSSFVICFPTCIACRLNWEWHTTFDLYSWRSGAAAAVHPKFTLCVCSWTTRSDYTQDNRLKTSQIGIKSFVSVAQWMSVFELGMAAKPNLSSVSVKSTELKPFWCFLKVISVATFLNIQIQNGTHTHWLNIEKSMQTIPFMNIPAEEMADWTKITLKIWKTIQTGFKFPKSISLRSSIGSLLTFMPKNLDIDKKMCRRLVHLQ